LVEKHERLAESKRQARREKIADYRLSSTTGVGTLSSLFANHDDLIMVHNVGQSCRYRTI
jgi:predicted dithiol-disulfide oxidoreductase (DUF899 family)